MRWQDYISVDPAICHGKACIRGTRIPVAVVRALDSEVGHKSTLAGFERQIALLSTAAGWPSAESGVRLQQIAYGSRHDKLDAFMGAWVASLPPERLLARGDGAHDTIWVPTTLPACVA